MLIKQGVRSVVRNSKGEILIALRGGKTRNYVGRWEIPGGEVGPGETPPMTAMRELMEALRLFVPMEELKTISVFKLRGWETHLYEVRIDDREPSIGDPDKCEAIKFVSLDTLIEAGRHGDLTPDTLITLEYLQAEPIFGGPFDW
jgi:8-oxo-dGTP pyrophosphatase MutT (NUDIX family)